MHQKWICHFTWHLPPLLTFVPVFYSPLWEIQSQTRSILLFSRIWCCWWKLETKCWESTFLAAWGAKQNVPSRLSDRAFSKNIWSKLPTKLKVRKTISLTKATQIQNVQSIPVLGFVEDFHRWLMFYYFPHYMHCKSYFKRFYTAFV